MDKKGLRIIDRMILIMIAIMLSCGFIANGATTLSGTENNTIHYTTDAIVNTYGSYTIGSNGFVVITGNLTINKNATLTVNGKLIVEGDLIMNNDIDWWGDPYNRSNLIVGVGGVVSIKKKLKGSGGVLTINTQNGNKYGTIAINEGLGSNGTFSISKNGQNTNKVNYAEAFYIDGATVNNGTSLSNTESSAYENSVEIIEEAAQLGLLPIELTSFTVEQTNYGFKFDWKTASEVNNEFFTIEFSDNGGEFIDIDYVQGAGTTSEISEYEYKWDCDIDAEVLYFRLKQTDFNGDYSFSDIVSVKVDKTNLCSNDFAGRKVLIGNKTFRVINNKLVYCENDNE